MIILGIDPGTATTGYGVVRKEGRNFVPLEYGCILTKAGTDPGARLVQIEKSLSKIIEKHRPEEVAVEKLFFLKNLKTGIEVAQARGVILLSLAKEGIKTFGYTPLEVKSSVTGYGQATKNQVQKMVQRILDLDTIPRPDDAADALAIAICHGCRMRIG